MRFLNTSTIVCVTINILLISNKLCANVDIFFVSTGIKNLFFSFQSQFLFFVSFRRCNMRKVEYTSMTTKTENMTIHVPAVTYTPK